MKELLVIKADGEAVPFERGKLMASLLRSGAAADVAEEIVRDIESELKEGTTTKYIYKKAFARLRKHSRPTAARYKLKKAIMELGPSGFPFEKYVEAILRAEGFSTKVGQIVRGKCISHEIDIIAEKDGKRYMCECKFHSQQERASDVKVALYIQSRFKDVEANGRLSDGTEVSFDEGWIFTNTRFTDDASDFGACAGLKLIGWNYPKKGNLKERVDTHGIHPVTCLTTLTSHEKKGLLKFEVVLVADLCKYPVMLERIGVKASRREKILAEARALCEV